MKKKTTVKKPAAVTAAAPVVKTDATAAKADVAKPAAAAKTDVAKPVAAAKADAAKPAAAVKTEAPAAAKPAAAVKAVAKKATPKKAAAKKTAAKKAPAKKAPAAAKADAKKAPAAAKAVAKKAPAAAKSTVKKAAVKKAAVKKAPERKTAVKKDKAAKKMSFDEIISYLKEKSAGFDASNYHDFLAIQVTLKDLNKVFYVEIKDHKLSIEPYEYNDRQSELVLSSENFMKMINGEVSGTELFFKFRLKINGSIEKAKELSSLFGK